MFKLSNIETVHEKMGGKHSRISYINRELHTGRAAVRTAFKSLDRRARRDGVNKRPRKYICLVGVHGYLATVEQLYIAINRVCLVYTVVL